MEQAAVAERVVVEQKVSKVPLSAGVMVVGKVETPLGRSQIKLVMEAWAIKQRMEADKKELDGIHARLLDTHGGGCALVVTGICRASLADRQTVKITELAALMKALGKRFGDLVNENVSYTATPKLLEIASDGDDPLQAQVAACLSIGHGQSVTWRAEK